MAHRVERANHFPRLWEFLKRRFNREEALGLGLTLGLAVVALATWAFGAVLEEVLDNATMVRWDHLATTWINAHTTGLGTHVALIVTAIGSPVVAVVGVVIGVCLLLRRDWVMVIAWSAILGGGAMLRHLIKITVQRHRPDYAPFAVVGKTWSFPSGHTMDAVLCYVGLAWLLIERFEWAERNRIAIMIPAWLIVIAVGWSRLYLGAHFPSDVVGGALIGVAWLALCAMAADVVSKRLRR